MGDFGLDLKPLRLKDRRLCVQIRLGSAGGRKNRLKLPPLGLPANSHELAKPKTILRVVPKIPETSVRNNSCRLEPNSTVASHTERGSRLLDRS